ncbi:MAG: DedA family protein [candidate division Zixibacteria bacterium]|nr:DedA family protein [candidate division Zixibacteria bacterium]
MGESFAANFNDLMAMLEAIKPLYIYLILFAIAFIENIFPPIPGDTFTIIGGYLAATGYLALAPTFLAITLGTISSVMVVYALGYRGGHEYFQKKNYKFFNADDLTRVDNLFNKYGAMTLLFSRFVVGARVMIAVAAGISKYPTGRMAVFSYISGVLFHGILIGFAFLLNKYIENITAWFALYSKIVLVIVGAVVILWVIIVIRRFRHGRTKT